GNSRRAGSSWAWVSACSCSRWTNLPAPTPSARKKSGGSFPSYSFSAACWPRASSLISCSSANCSPILTPPIAATFSPLRSPALGEYFRRQGRSDPERAAGVLLYNFVRYEADNLVFATIYAAFFVASLVLAGLCLALWTWLRLRKWMELPSPSYLWFAHLP